MAVYVDDAIWRWAGRNWCHLLADDTDELHRFAARIGVHRLLYQGPPKTSAPHYDITGLERDRAVGWARLPAAATQIVAVFRACERSVERRWRGKPVARTPRPVERAPDRPPTTVSRLHCAAQRLYARSFHTRTLVSDREKSGGDRRWRRDIPKASFVRGGQPERNY